MKDKRAVIVGTGLASLLAGAICRRRGWAVTFVEQDAAPGGLLRSRVGPAGTPVDLGTHLPRETGDPTVDELLFATMGEPEWQDIGPLRPAHVLYGRLDARTEFPSVQALGPRLREQAEQELLSITTTNAGATNLAEALLAQMGPTVTEDVFRPVMRKLTGCELEGLSPTANHLFARRIVAFSEDEARRHKRNDRRLDEVLGFHDSTQGASPLPVWYPVQGGIGRWIDELLAGPLRHCSVLTGSVAASVELTDGRARSVTTSGGHRLEADLVVWGVGVHPFRLAAGLPRPSDAQPARMRHALITHLSLDRRLPVDAHYVTIFDPGLRSFRVTPYDNLRRTDHDHTVTVEALLAPEETAPTADQLLHELIGCGIADPSTRVLASQQERVANGFPVPTPELARTAGILLSATADVGGVVFVGRGRGTSFFMADVLREVPQLLDVAVA